MHFSLNWGLQHIEFFIQNLLFFWVLHFWWTCHGGWLPKKISHCFTRWICQTRWKISDDYYCKFKGWKLYQKIRKNPKPIKPLRIRKFPWLLPNTNTNNRWDLSLVKKFVVYFWIWWIYFEENITFACFKPNSHFCCEASFTYFYEKLCEIVTKI